MSNSRSIVVFGATGQIGSALINWLSKNNTGATPVYDVVALSRDPSTGSSQKLASLPGVRVVRAAKNYMDEPSKAFQAAGLGNGQVYGVFSNQGYVSDALMVSQGKAIADAAHELRCEHFIYSSAHLGSLDPPIWPSFQAKYTVEQHIKSLGMDYTFLRPSQFMDNLLPTSAFMFKITRTMLLRRTFYKHPERKHQMVSTRDIGLAGARAFEQPERYKCRIVVLSGDEFTMPELERIYKEEMGKPVDETNATLISLIKAMVPFLKNMAEFLDEVGFCADIPALRQEFPELEDLRAFLRRYREERGI